MIIAPGRHQHPSSGADRPSDVSVTVKLNGEYKLMAANRLIESFSRDLVSGYCQGLESSAAYTVASFFVESLHGHSDRSQPHLPLHLPAEELIPTCLMSNIFIGLCRPKPLTLKRLQ
jgi:hypothetical protein